MVGTLAIHETQSFFFEAFIFRFVSLWTVLSDIHRGSHPVCAGYGLDMTIVYPFVL